MTNRQKDILIGVVQLVLFAGLTTALVFLTNNAGFNEKLGQFGVLIPLAMAGSVKKMFDMLPNRQVKTLTKMVKKAEEQLKYTSKYGRIDQIIKSNLPDIQKIAEIERVLNE